MRLNVKRSVLIFVLFCVSVSASAGKDDDDDVEKLSTDIRLLLQKEMVALDLAMKGIVSANAAGDYKQISLIAKQIKDSFILKQSLTKQQKHELHNKLPVDFIKQDEQFHYFAGMLVHAAKNNKSELVVFYYSKLFEACSTCHKSHAKHRFAKFGELRKPNEHTH